jgi:hypothetical protein
MKKATEIVLTSLLIIFIFSSCRKTDQFSIIPNVSFREFIQYKNIAGKDTAIDFIINFQDGDGDLGYSENEYFKCGVPLSNLFIYYEEKIGNTYVPKKFLEHIYDINDNCDTIGERDDSLQLSFSSRMTNIQPRGSDKSIEGTVSYNLSKNNILFLSPKGRFRFYIIDRAGHQSNIEYSAELSITK